MLNMSAGVPVRLPEACGVKWGDFKKIEPCPSLGERDGISGVLGAPSCRKSDTGMAEDLTRNRLRQIADAVVDVVARETSLDGRKFSGILGLCFKRHPDRGSIPKGEARDRVFERDGWGNPFTWRAEKNRGKAVSVRILSAGGNRVLEMGKETTFGLNLKSTSIGEPLADSTPSRGESAGFGGHGVRGTQYMGFGGHNTGFGGHNTGFGGHNT